MGHSLIVGSWLFFIRSLGDQSILGAAGRCSRTSLEDCSHSYSLSCDHGTIVHNPLFWKKAKFVARHHPGLLFQPPSRMIFPADLGDRLSGAVGWTGFT